MGVDLRVFFRTILMGLSRQALEKRRYNALDKWTEALESVHAVVISKNPGANRGPGDPGLGGGDPFSAYPDPRYERY